MVLVALLTFLGCAFLALTQKRNWRAVSNLTLTSNTKARLNIMGWLLQGVALLLCVLVEGAGFAALLWPLFFASGSFMVAMLLSYRPHFLRPIARLSLLLTPTL